MRIKNTQLRKIIKEELSRLGRLREAPIDDDYYGDDDPFGDDEAIEQGLEYVPGSGYKKPAGGGPDRFAQDAFARANPKPVGLIIDVSAMEGAGGGDYPVYMSDGSKLTMIAADFGEAAYVISEFVTENGQIPGIFFLHPSDEPDEYDQGVFHITAGTF